MRRDDNLVDARHHSEDCRVRHQACLDSLLGQLLSGLMASEFRRGLAYNHLEISFLLRFNEEVCQRATRVIRKDQVIVTDMLLGLPSDIVF